MNQCSISIIITTINRASLLRETLEALDRQTASVSEVIVIDDGGTDNSKEITESFGSSYHYYKQNNSGVQSARNLGILKSKGNWIAFLDDDDIWEPNRLEIIKKIVTIESIDLITSDFSIFQGDEIIERSFFSKHAKYLPAFWKNLERKNQELYSVFDGIPPIQLFPEYPFWGATLVLSKKKIQNIGGWDVTVRGIPSEDLDFVFRALRGTRFALIWEPTIRYRSHSGNTSRDSVHKLLGRVEIAKRLIKKERLNDYEVNFLTDFINKSQEEALWSYFRRKDYKLVLNLSRTMDSKASSFSIKIKVAISYILLNLKILFSPN